MLYSKLFTYINNNYENRLKRENTMNKKNKEREIMIEIYKFKQIFLF